MKSTGNYFFMKKAELKQNFTQIPNELLNLNISTTEKLVLIYLFSNAEDFRITIYRIKETIGIDQRIVKKAIAKFKTIGFIRSINTNTFIIDIDKIKNYKTLSIETCNSTTSKNTLVENYTCNSTPIDSNSTLVETCNSTPISSKITPNLVVELPSNNTKQEEVKKESNNTNYNTNEILVFGFSEVSFNSIQKSNFNKVSNYFRKTYNLPIEDFKNLTIEYYKYQTKDLQLDLPIELESANNFGNSISKYYKAKLEGKLTTTNTNTSISNNNALNPIYDSKNSTSTSSFSSVLPIEFTKLTLGDDYLIYFQNKLTELRTINSSITVDQFEEEIIEYLTGNQFSIDTIPNQDKLIIEQWLRDNINLNTQHIRDMFYNIKEIFQ